jgi:hypothetical protein
MSEPLKVYLEQYQIYDTNVYALPMNVFKNLDIKMWKFNRPPDTTRISEINEAMKKNNRMDGLINLAFIPHEGLVCYEGNHRRLALEGNNFPVFIDVLWDVTDERVTEEFRRLNKSVSVPELYISETDATIKVEIEQLVSEFRKKFPDHVSSSARPIRPNFNRDKFTDEISRIQKELMIPVSQISSKLYALNERLASQDKTKLTDSIKKKCEKSGFWLFAWSTTIPTKEL